MRHQHRTRNLPSRAESDYRRRSLGVPDYFHQQILRGYVCQAAVQLLQKLRRPLEQRDKVRCFLLIQRYDRRLWVCSVLVQNYGSREGPFYTSVIHELPFFHPAILPLFYPSILHTDCAELECACADATIARAPTCDYLSYHSPGKIVLCAIPTLAEHVITNHTKSDNSWNGNCRVFLVGESRVFLASGSEHTITLVALRFLVRAFSRGGRIYSLCH